MKRVNVIMQTLAKNLSTYLDNNNDILKDKSEATKLFDSIGVSYLKKKISKKDIEAINKKASTINGTSKDWSKFVNDRIAKLKKNPGLVETSGTLDQYLDKHTKSKLMHLPVGFTTTYIQGSSKKEKSSTDSPVKIIEKATSKIQLKSSTTDDSSMADSKDKLLKEFVVIRFKADDERLERIKKHINKAYSGDNYILVKNSNTTYVFVMELDKAVGAKQYKREVYSICKPLLIKPTKAIMDIEKNITINKNKKNDNIIAKKDDGQALPITTELKKPVRISSSFDDIYSENNNLNYSYRKMLMTPECQKRLAELGMGKFFEMIQTDPLHSVNDLNSKTGYKLKLYDVRRTKRYAKTLKELEQRLENIREAYKLVTKSDYLPNDIVLKILKNNVLWLLPLDGSSMVNIDEYPLYFWNPDEGIYTSDIGAIDSLIGRLAENEVRDTIFANYRHRIAERYAQWHIPDQLKSRDLVPLNNGVFNLKTKEFKKYTPEMYFTRKAYTDYNPKAVTIPHLGPDGWFSPISMIKEMSQNDEGKFTLICQAILASLMGAYWLKKMLLIVDEQKGNTGKSVLIEFIESLISGGVLNKKGYAAMSIDDLTPEMVANAFGKNAMLGDELANPDKPIDVMGSLKQIIANNDTPIHILKVAYFTGKLNVFLIQTANFMPKFGDNGDPVYNRMIAVKMVKTFVKNHKHDKIEEYILQKDVRESFVYWLLHNISIRDGLTPTDESDRILKHQQIQQDSFLNFDNTVLKHIHYVYIPKRVLYAAYRNFAYASKYKDKKILDRSDFEEKMDEYTDWTYKHMKMPVAYSDKTRLTKCTPNENGDPKDIATAKKYGFKTESEIKPPYYSDKDYEGFNAWFRSYRKAAGTKFSDYPDKQLLNEPPEVTTRWTTNYYINVPAKQEIDNQIKRYNRFSELEYILEALDAKYDQLDIKTYTRMMTKGNIHEAPTRPDNIVDIIKDITASIKLINAKLSDKDIKTLKPYSDIIKCFTKLPDTLK